MYLCNRFRSVIETDLSRHIQSDSLGKIVDMRDKSTCPNLANFMKKPSAEIKSLCVTAFEKQMEALKEAEGDGVKLYRELKADLAEVGYEKFFASLIEVYHAVKSFQKHFYLEEYRSSNFYFFFYHRSSE